MKITINDIYDLVVESVTETIACLGASYPKSGDLKGDNIRALAHRIKNGDDAAINKAASLLCKYVQPNSILIPVPSHTGRSTYTLKLAKLIAMKAGVKVLDVIRSEPREMLYNRKLKNININDVELGFYCVNDVNGSIVKTLKNASNVILIDNVVDSGITYEQAHKALLTAYGVNSWMLSLGVVEKSVHDIDDDRVFRSIIKI